ncbi:hypothetical protein ACQJBY_073415 [Aegilops geniculata]
MTVIDFIDLSDDDIIDLSSSDDETDQEDQIATQHQVASLDKQDVFVLAGEGSRGVQAVFVATGEGSQDEQAVFVAASEGSQDRQAVFVAASEGRQEASEPGHALEATTSSMIIEEAPLVAASEGSQHVHSVFVSASEGRQETTKSGHALEATTSSMVMEKATLVAASGGSQDVQRVLVAAGEGRQEAAESEHALEATTLSLVTEKLPLDTAKSPYCHRSPTSAPFPSPTSTTPKVQTSEGGDAKSVRVKRKYCKGNYHTDTPRRSPRLIQMGECCTNPVEEPAADYKRSLMLGPAEEAAASTDSALTAVLTMPHVGSTSCLRSPTSATFPSSTSTPPKAQTSEGGDAKPVSMKAKYRKKNYHTDTPRRSPRLIQMGECCTSPVEEPTADHKRSRTLRPTEESVASIDSAETVVLALPHAGSTNCLRPPTSAPFPSLTSTSPKAVTSEGGDAKLWRAKAKHPERNYHILSLVRGKSPLGPTSTSPKALFSEDGDAKPVTGKVKRRRKNCRPCKLTP